MEAMLDLIAQADTARQLIGGSEDAVLKETEARQSGVLMSKPFALKVAKGDNVVDLVAQATGGRQ